MLMSWLYPRDNLHQKAAGCNLIRDHERVASKSRMVAWPAADRRIVSPSRIAVKSLFTAGEEPQIAKSVVFSTGKLLFFNNIFREI